MSTPSSTASLSGSTLSGARRKALQKLAHREKLLTSSQPSLCTAVRARARAHSALSVQLRWICVTASALRLPSIASASRVLHQVRVAARAAAGSQPAVPRGGVRARYEQRRHGNGDRAPPRAAVHTCFGALHSARYRNFPPHAYIQQPDTSALCNRLTHDQALHTAHWTMQCVCCAMQVLAAASADAPAARNQRAGQAVERLRQRVGLYPRPFEGLVESTGHVASGVMRHARARPACCCWPSSRTATPARRSIPEAI